MELVNKLDDYGMPAWIGLMVLGFIVFWPVGLALLAYLIWSGRMGSCKGRRGRWQEKMERFKSGGSAPRWRSSGNRAFDEYREETLRRLEDEQKDFKKFLAKLRMAKDKAEFDQFMTDRSTRPPGPTTESGPQDPNPQPQS